MADSYWAAVGDKIKSRDTSRRKSQGKQRVLKNEKYSPIGRRCPSCGSVIKKGGVLHPTQPHLVSFCDMDCYAMYADPREALES